METSHHFNQQQLDARKGGQETISSFNNQQQYRQCQESREFDGKNLSRRSVDWRDSGIVIDDLDFHSIDAIRDFPQQQHHHSSSSVSSIRSTSNSIFINTDSSNSIISCQQTPINQFQLGQALQLEKFVYEQDEDGDTILHLAVVGCSPEKVQDLIRICDQDCLNAINNMMQTPLHVATMANRPEMVGLLIESGARVELQDRRGNSPLHLACQKGFSEIVEIILRHTQSKKKSKNCSCLSQNSTCSFCSEANSFIDQLREMTNFDGQTCLHLAASNNHKEIIKSLIDNHNFDINSHDSKSGSTILNDAIKKLNLDLINYILNLERHCNEADYYQRRPLDTIRKFKSSIFDVNQLERLTYIERTIIERINLCAARGGCCTNNYGSLIGDNNLESSGSSSSEFSDSESDIS